MGFQIYLVSDAGESFELECESIDVDSVFNIQDVQDIAARKTDNLSIQIKGTKNNNQAFGLLFDLGRTSDFNIDNKLFFNYNPLRSVTCLIYESSSLIYKGSLRISDMKIDKTGAVIYNAVVTKTLIDFKSAITDKKLEDLDFGYLKHRWNLTNITNSWSSSIEKWNNNTQSFYTVPFQYGNGYVYPNIDYGYFPEGTGSSTATTNSVMFRNFKPAIYATEYLDKIFSQDGLSGFTYEVKGSPDFLEMFNHLIVPDAQEGYTSKPTTGITSSYSKSLLTLLSWRIIGGDAPWYSNENWWKLMPIGNNVINPSPLIVGPLFKPYGGYPEVLEAVRDLTANARCAVQVTSNYLVSSNIIGDKQKFEARLVKRASKNNNLGSDGWATIGSTTFEVTGNTIGAATPHNYDLHFIVSPNEYKTTDQIGLMVYALPRQLIYNDGTYREFYFSATTASVLIPSDANQPVVYGINPSVTSGDTITPMAPVGIKQSDFIKSLMLQFNLYAYSTLDNPKHLIFQKYDDYYIFSTPAYIKNNSLDWTNKIDYNQGFEIKTNIALPKNYQFLYKEDTDYFTENYKKKFSEVYGQFSFEDRYGLTDTKKVELIFSPTIIISDTGTDRKYPALYKVESNVKDRTKTNIRLNYYNGLQPCQPYNICMLNSLSAFTSIYTATTYPSCSNYYIKDGAVQNDIHWNNPREIYFSQSADYVTASNSFNNYYINQVSDLTKGDVIYITCNALLNDIDISNLDLRIPVYIDTGSMGGAYFKVLSVDYNGQDVLSKVSLQKIVF